MIDKPGQTYLDTLLLYYEEEIEGEAYFLELASVFEPALQKQKLELLAEVERHAAAAVEPLVAKYNLTPRSVSDLVKSGQKQARETNMNWSVLIDDMTKTYPAYLAAFRNLESIGPAIDRQRLSFLTQHEVAAIAFLDAEVVNAPNSATPLYDYLATRPEDWIVVDA